MIPIYKAEVQDGLSSKIKSTASVACYSKPTFVQPRVNSHLNKVFAENLYQPDLYYMQAILVSTVWNLNDDVFVPEEVWAARKSPEDKPLNIMHAALDIIGHQTANKAVDDDYNVIPDDTPVDMLPNKFHILINSVIYTQLDDAKKQKEINKLIAEIEQSKWFVSMEAYFNDFDFALRSENEYKIIKRNSATAFLTKYLRSYGGPGVYEDSERYQIGRVLRNIYFSGAGIVEVPANPESVILTKALMMSENFEQKFKDLEVKHTELTAKYNGLCALASADKAKIKELEENAKVLANKLAQKERVDYVKSTLKVDEAQASEIVNQHIQLADEEFRKQMKVWETIFASKASVETPKNPEVQALNTPEKVPGIEGNVDVQSQVLASVEADIQKFTYGEQ